MTMSSGGVGISSPRFSGRCAKCHRDIQSFIQVNRVDTESFGIVGEYWCLNCVRRGENSISFIDLLERLPMMQGLPIPITAIYPPINQSK